MNQEQLSHSASVAAVNEYSSERSLGATQCPVCEESGTRMFVKYGYWIRACGACGHRFTELDPAEDHVDAVYGDEYFKGGGSGYPDYIAEASILREHGRRYGRLLSRHMRPGRVLDVGAAAGYVLQGLVDTGWRGVGIEPNLGMVDYGRRHLGLDVIKGTLEEFETDDRFDLISMIQVAAHFRDVRKALTVAAALTRPSGFWLVETWNPNSLTARAFGRQWHEYSPPSTLNYFSLNSLSRIAGQFGFRQVDRGRPTKRIDGAHAKSLLKFKLQGSALGRLALSVTRLVPDKIQIPYPSEDLFWVLYQKS